MASRLLALVAALSLATAAVAPISLASTPAAASSASASSDTLRTAATYPPYTDAREKVVTAKMFDLINKTRAGRSKPAVKLHPEMTAVAQAWADQLAKTQVLKHNPKYATQIPGGWMGAAENVAWRGNQNLDALHNQWAKSPGHFANMIGDHTHVGVAVARASDGSVWGVQVFAKYPKPAKAYTATEAASAQKTLLSLISKNRTSAGLKNLTTSAKMNAMALSWAKQMAAGKGLAGMPNYGASLPKGWQAAVQLVSVDSGGSVTKAHQNLTGNATNFSRIKGSYSHVGVGAARATNGKVYVVELFARYPSTVKPG